MSKRVVLVREIATVSQEVVKLSDVKPPGRLVSGREIKVAGVGVSCAFATKRAGYCCIL